MGRIVEDIYRDITIAPQLGFKGGTAVFVLWFATVFRGFGF
jgi:hypothetical protein